MKQNHADELSKVNNQINKLKSLLEVAQKRNQELEKEHEHIEKKEKKAKNELAVKNE